MCLYTGWHVPVHRLACACTPAGMCLYTGWHVPVHRLHCVEDAASAEAAAKHYRVKLAEQGATLGQPHMCCYADCVAGKLVAGMI
jgi:hypothetical protein